MTDTFAIGPFGDVDGCGNPRLNGAHLPTDWSPTRRVADCVNGGDAARGEAASRPLLDHYCDPESYDGPMRYRQLPVVSNLPPGEVGKWYGSRQSCSPDMFGGLC
jgi:hypothetical protein